MSEPLTTYDKILAAHHVHHDDTRGDTVYIDRHFLHPETSPQAFDGLRLAKRDVRVPDMNFAPHADAIGDNPIVAKQLDTLDANAHDFHLARFDKQDLQNGLTQPGMVLAGHADDIAPLGAFGVYTIAVNAAEVEHILATQTLILTRPPVLRVMVAGNGQACTAEKILAQVLAAVSPAVLEKHVIEYDGAAIKAMSLFMRMDLAARTHKCSRGVIFPPDAVVFDALKESDFAPSGRDWAFAQEHWESFIPDVNAAIDHSISIDGAKSEAVA